MEKEPLLPCSSPIRRPPPLLPLFSLPENNEISPRLPLAPSELKEILIFGASSSPNPFSPKPSSPLLQSYDLSQLPDPTRHETHLPRSKTAPAMFAIHDLVRRPARPKPVSSSHLIIRQALILVSVYLSLGVTMYWFSRDMFDSSETHPVVDAFYFCIVTMCTIGYGDITPNSTTTKLFSILFVIVGFGFVDILLTGIVTYVLDLQENYLLRAARDGSYIVDVKKKRMRIRTKVALALGVVFLCIAVGALFMHYVENLGWLDSVYLSVMSVTTVGYGDQAFTSLSGRIFASVWLLVSTLAVTRACLYLAEARVHKRQRRLTKLVLSRDMTVAEFLAADLDNNGFVSKSEYVIYKLKEMGKVSETDILQICEIFDRLDVGNCGKIRLADLMERRR